MDLLSLEQQRQALELNLEKLRQSLKHWQTWEAEYEGLKEEILGVEGDVTPEKLVYKFFDHSRAIRLTLPSRPLSAPLTVAIS